MRIRGSNQSTVIDATVEIFLETNLRGKLLAMKKMGSYK